MVVLDDDGAGRIRTVVFVLIWGNVTCQNEVRAGKNKLHHVRELILTDFSETEIRLRRL